MQIYIFYICYGIHHDQGYTMTPFHYSLHFTLSYMIPICIWVPPVRLTSFTFPVHSHARSHFITLYSFDTRFSIIYSSGKYLYSVLQFIVYPLIMMYSVTYVEDVYLHIICKEFVVNMQI